MKFGRYEVIKELGKGAMGVVYQAHDPQIDRFVALKVLRSDRVTDEGFVQRFLKEAKAIGRLSHPNMVTIYDVGQDQETVYIAMEFLEGKPLHTLIQEESLPSEKVIDLGSQIAMALDYAHQKGIVHRDIKPANIIVQPNGQAKITDFGIAHLEDPSAAQQTQAGEILGSPAYMPPEQVMGQPVDGRSDLYSLGVILYELCSGQRPFQGDNLAALFRAITQDNPVDPVHINPALSPELSHIVLKCLHKQADGRFQSGRALAEALKSVHGKASASDKPSGSSRRIRSKSRLSYFLIMAFALIFIIGISFYMMNSRNRKDKNQDRLKAPKSAEDTLTGQTATPAPVAGPAFLMVKSTPVEAQVFVDGNFRGKSPVRVELSPGKHEVRISLSGYYDWEAQIQLKEGKETNLPVRLIRMSDS
ncbi:MAG: protein kinase domain-containing protein [bacterium]